MSYVYLVASGIIIYLVVTLVCMNKSNCNFSLFQIGDNNQCNGEDEIR